MGKSCTDFSKYFFLYTIVQVEYCWQYHLLYRFHITSFNIISIAEKCGWSVCKADGYSRSHQYIPISFINLQNKFSVLTIIEGTDYLKAFDAKQLQSQIMFLLSTYNKGLLIAQVFWGLWLFPFGYLVYKSGFLPKILGILLMLGCFGYLINVFGRIGIPHFSDYSISNYITLPATIGEIGICLWLLLAGARNRNVNQN